MKISISRLRRSRGVSSVRRTRRRGDGGPSLRRRRLERAFRLGGPATTSEGRTTRAATRVFPICIFAVVCWLRWREGGV
ncbi:hypothetical protein SODALDRAFT_128888 [Sodiomyces alkalinus F11]|uniref:Uncharacterized protein n=1 Tax=Sodiomyces alkalinus (strain CBS 110278 / VKM F-3762 / F11) TaxID=1314773 RepID=A0A3N2Q4Y9_SODAK|nr:hypothetical protein SODALDRAFT_128888 [Sodiomyces alkalinus F11]ROT41767.1 hypothetical protein SODALDRAFT_128888 [Sodiomyces alkalinus F11]